MAFGFRCEGVDDEAADQAADGGNEDEEPGDEGVDVFGEEGGFAAWGGLVVAGEAGEGEVDDELAGDIEDDGAESGYESDEGGEEHDFDVGLEAAVAELPDLREPAERVDVRSLKVSGWKGCRPWYRGSFRG